MQGLGKYSIVSTGDCAVNPRTLLAMASFTGTVTMLIDLFQALKTPSQCPIGQSGWLGSRQTRIPRHVVPLHNMGGLG